MNQPYAGVFLKKNDDEESDIVKSLDDVYRVGSFVKITESQKTENKMHIIATAYRRIRIVKEKETRDRNSKTGLEQETSQSILEVEVENVDTPKVELTNEIRAVQQEIIRTIRDMISLNPLFKYNFFKQIMYSYGIQKTYFSL